MQDRLELTGKLQAMMIGSSVNIGNQPTDLTMAVASLNRQQSDSSGLWRLSSDNAGHSSAKRLKVACLIVDMDVHFVRERSKTLSSALHCAELCRQTSYIHISFVF